MDPKLLLVKCITLLYRESQLGAQTNSAELCKEVIEAIRLPEATMEVDSGREVLVGLRGTVLYMAENPATHVYDKAPLLQRIRVNVKDDQYLYQAVEDSTAEATDVEIQKEVSAYRRELLDYLNRGKVDALIKNAFNQIIHKRGQVDYRAFAQTLMTELEPHTHASGSQKAAGVVDTLDFNDTQGMEDFLTRAQEETSTEGVLRTGWQAINRMFGEQGGARRGEMILTAALQHNFKTGLTLNLFKHFALYNKPHMRDPKLKPLLIHLSAENELATNIMWLYVNLKENETGEICDPSTIDPKEAREYVKARMEATGYHIHMRRVDPSVFTIFDYADMVADFESKGYEIHAIVIDYLNMFNKRGCAQGPAGADVRDIFRRVRNIGAPRGITTVTPHQLSTEAKALVRQNVDNFVKEIANKGYYDSCRTIDQEVDMEIMIHIEKHDGKSYLTCQRGKHRKVSITKDADLYTVLPFSPAGGVRDDIDSDDTSMTSVGGGLNSEGGGKAWWE